MNIKVKMPRKATIKLNEKELDMLYVYIATPSHTDDIAVFKKAGRTGKDLKLAMDFIADLLVEIEKIR